MASSKADFTMHKMRAIGGGYKWWCRFDYENKYGGTVGYACSDVSLDKALADLINKLDAAGLLGVE